MSYGYSVQLVDAIRQGDANHLGVRLGRACVGNDLPARTVAVLLGVSRQTVYNWFYGKSNPENGSCGEAIQRLLDKLEQ